MVVDFATQMGVTRLPNLTGDGRDGFPTKAQHDWCVEQYLFDMCEKKRGKALVNKSLYDRILAVCIDKSNKKTETAQFRWWVRRTFNLYSGPSGQYLMHENRPIAIKEQIYDILIYCHAECGHGGRDKTSATVRQYFSWIPKDVVSRFVSVCPGCHARTQKDDEYFSNKGADGYYPVHDKVRNLSIIRNQATPENYGRTLCYQPLLAPGMLKIIKTIEEWPARAFTAPSPEPIASALPQLLGPPLTKINEPPQSMDVFHPGHSGAVLNLGLQSFPGCMNQSALGMMTSDSLSGPPQFIFSHEAESWPTQVPTPSLHPDDQSLSSASSQHSFLNPESQAPFNSLELNKENIPLYLSNAVDSPSYFPIQATPMNTQGFQKTINTKSRGKPGRKPTARKTNSKSKACKKGFAAVGNLVNAPAIPGLATVNLPLSANKAGQSEDDTTTKSRTSSPSVSPPVIFPTYNYNIQKFDGCNEIVADPSQSLILGGNAREIGTSEYIDAPIKVFDDRNIQPQPEYNSQINHGFIQEALPKSAVWSSTTTLVDNYANRPPAISHQSFVHSPLLSVEEASYPSNFSTPTNHVPVQEAAPVSNSWKNVIPFAEGYVLTEANYPYTYPHFNQVSNEPYDGVSINDSVGATFFQNHASPYPQYDEGPEVTTIDPREEFMRGVLNKNYDLSIPLPQEQIFRTEADHNRSLGVNECNEAVSPYERNLLPQDH
ncbi:hypothetical protein PPACK8108_LOCUS20617 [Phakopsora pachyrhizi]|uniref:Integrase zinc-binding domain-containing protein n=1 Tax=Phakopsora pachyrhizi TaxID=170000 RepID=A0AAV0BFU1_PHAPC|nr:hypothetical protein PPACK8108_LOCUS20617 [Phakopsora pachyrhizi]